MINIKVKDHEPFEKAFKRFTKACEKAGLIANIKKYQFFEKPCEARKRKENQAKRKLRKLMAELENPRRNRKGRSKRR
jgi:small subunit ribosomal protein S21